MQSQPVRPEILKREKEFQPAEPITLLRALNLKPEFSDYKSWFRLLLWPMVVTLILFLSWYSTVSFPDGAFFGVGLVGNGVLALLLTYFAVMKGVDPLVDYLTFFGCSSEIPSYFLSENTLSVCNIARGLGYFVVYWVILWAWTRFFEAWDVAAQVRDLSYGPLGVFGGPGNEEKAKILKETKAKYQKYLLWNSIILFVFCVIFLQPAGSKDTFNLVVSELQVMGFNRMESLAMAIKEHVK